MKELTKAHKRDVGASLVWSVLNSINGHLEQLDRQYLEMTRILLEHKRRLDTLGITVDHHRKILSADDTRVTMFCISCPYEFELPREEAEAQEYLVTCPECGTWALLKDQVPQEYTVEDIARISGFSESTAFRTLRENKLNSGIMGKQMIFNEEKAQQVFALLEKKRPRRGPRKNRDFGGNGNGNKDTSRRSHVSGDRKDHDVRGDQHPDVA